MVIIRSPSGGASGSAVNYINSYRLSLRGVLFQVGPLPVERQEEGGADSRKKILRREEMHFFGVFTSPVASGRPDRCWPLVQVKQQDSHTRSSDGEF